MTRMKLVSLNDIKQTKIDDAGKDALCTALCNLQMAAAALGLKPDLSQIDAWIDECVKVGALRSKDKKNSDGFVLSHEKMAEVVGLKGVKKVYKKFDKAEIINLLQWGRAVELRDEGKHSLLAVGWLADADGKAFADCLDPWPYSNDVRLDLQRAMTQNVKAGVLVDSRSIEYYGIYEEVKK